MGEHRFQVEASWEGGRLGTGELTAEGLRTAISIPGQLGGPGAGTNPEEMLIGSAMTCYIITLAAILEKRNVEVKSLRLQSEGILTVENGSLGFRKIIHRPNIVLGTADDKMIETVTHAAHRAEKACMISKAMRGNVEFAVEPEIHTEG